MDDLIPILFIAVAVVVSILRKIGEKSRETGERDRREVKRTTAADLPPETRRAIYGSGGDIRVARPKGAPPEERPAPLTPRVARPAPSRQPVQAQPVAQRPEPVAQRREVVARPAPSARPTLRDRAQEIRSQIEKAFQEAMEQSAPPRPSRPQRPARPPRQRPAVAAPQQRRRAPERRPVPREERARRRRLGPEPQFLGNLSDVRRGIILSEVLGPPKALR